MQSFLIPRMIIKSQSFNTYLLTTFHSVKSIFGGKGVSRVKNVVNRNSSMFKGREVRQCRECLQDVQQTKAWG